MGHSRCLHVMGAKVSLFKRDKSIISTSENTGNLETLWLPRIEKKKKHVQFTLPARKESHGFHIFCKSKNTNRSSPEEPRIICRKSRRSWNSRRYSDRFYAAQTNWPVPQLESIFLPEFKILDAISGKFVMKDVISRGAFSSVSIGYMEDTSQLIAIKVMDKKNVIQENSTQQSKSEVSLQKLFSHHPFIVSCLHAFQTKHTLFIITEYIPGGELFSLWQKFSPLPDHIVKLYIAEISLVLDFLHNGGIIYRDLKMENILLDNDGHIVLTDFGFSKRLRQGYRTYTICGTENFIAPEILTGNGYDHAVDWWSLGMIMFALLNGQFPEYVDNHVNLQENEIWFSIPNDMKADTSLFVSKLLRRNPRLRIQGLTEFKRENYFKYFNFDEVMERQIKPKALLEEWLKATDKGNYILNPILI